MFLALLAEEDMHGYDLKGSCDTLMPGESVLNFGQVYTTLLRLERDGLIVLRESGGADKKVYGITSQGREELCRWLTEEPRESLTPYDELTYKLAAARVLGPEEFISVVRAYRKALMAEMQRLTKKKLLAGKEQPGAWLMLERSLLRLEADVRWTEACMDMLSREGQRDD